MLSIEIVYIYSSETNVVSGEFYTPKADNYWPRDDAASNQGGKSEGGFLTNYSIYRYYRRYSGIISNRRCFLGVRPNAFQIEDIAECKSSSNDQKSKNKPLTIGMIFGISSI